MELQYWDRKGNLVTIPPFGFVGTAGLYVKKGEVPVVSPAATPEEVNLVPPYGAVRGQLKVLLKAKNPIGLLGEPQINHTRVCQKSGGAPKPPTTLTYDPGKRSNVIVYSASSGPFRSDVLRLRPHYLTECFARWGYDVRYFPMSSTIPEPQVAPGLRQFKRADFFGYMQDLLDRGGPPGLFICSSLCNAETMLLVDHIKARGWKVLYEVRDDPEGMKGGGAKFGTWYNVNLERRMCSIADAVTVVSTPLRDRAIALGAPEERVFTYPNGIEDELRFHANNSWSEESVKARREERKIIGYFGHMFSGRFDADIVAQAAKDMPDVDFELIGPGLENPERLALPNVKLFGQQTPDEFYRIAKRWDIGMLPFKLNRITFSIDPIKYYQYLAAGVKIVHSDIYILRGAPLTHLYHAEKSLASVLRSTLAREVTAEEGRQIIDYLARETWESRAAATLAAIGMPQFAKELA